MKDILDDIWKELSGLIGDQLFVKLSAPKKTSGASKTIREALSTIKNIHGLIDWQIDSTS